MAGGEVQVPKHTCAGPLDAIEHPRHSCRKDTENVGHTESHWKACVPREATWDYLSLSVPRPL